MKKLFTIAALLFAVSAVAQDGFITKALNDADEPTFNWNKAAKFIPIAISESVGEAMPAEDVVFDATVDDNRNFLYVWEETYAGADQDGSLNSFGQPEDHIAMNVTAKGWSGCGFCAVNATQDWSVLDESWVFHFAIKSTDNASHQIVIGEEYGFTIGTTEVNGAKVLGDFTRNGEWYYVDIPYSVIKQLAVVPMWGSDPTAYTGNYLKILSGGVQGTQLRLDNVFWYKDNTIQVAEPIDDVYILGEVDGYGWTPNDGLHLTEMEEGVYVGTFFTDGRNDGYNYFSFTSKITAVADGWDEIAPYRFGAVSEGDFWVTEEMYGQPLALTQTDYQAFRLPFGFWDIKVDVNDMVVVINRLPDPVPEVYILGEVNGNMWDPSVGVAMDTEDGLIYTAEIECDGRNDGYNYFSFTKHLGENGDSWDAIADYRFGAVSEGDFWVTPELLGQPIALTGENGQALKIAAGTYNLKLDMGELTLVIEGEGIGTRGDLNGDGIVDVSDVNIMIDMVLGKQEQTAAADLTADGTIDVSDVNALIDIVLGK